MTDTQKIADLLFPEVSAVPQDLEEKYPPRALPEGARVTRFSPSPTGYLHIGGLFGALADYMTAKATGGVFYLRIEDTDKKREIEDGVSGILEGLRAFGITPDEGVTGFDSETGAYGPYTQSKRVEIYHIVAKDLVRRGLAYPCFCTADELTALREQQEKDGAPHDGQRRHNGQQDHLPCAEAAPLQPSKQGGKGQKEDQAGQQIIALAV